MRQSLLDLLVDPVSAEPLKLAGSAAGGDVAQGMLSSSRAQFPVSGGIPRFVATEDSGQLQTKDSFAFKWRRVESYGSAAMRGSARAWLLERYGFPTAEAMRAFFAGHRRILDAGCGSGYSAGLWLAPGWRGASDAEWFGADISEAIDVAKESLGGIEGTHFLQADILQLPFPPESFDAIFSEGVMHHTPSTRAAFEALVRLLRPGGEILFYVYRRKSPVREFTDDHVRQALAGLSPEEAWEALRPLTRLAQSLADLNVAVDVPEAVPLLGIPAGRQDLQRLIYWHFAKLFWNPAYSFEENLHVNFDWYHPRYAHRHTEDELRAWCGGAGLRIAHFNAQESGFTVRAVKDAG